MMESLIIYASGFLAWNCTLLLIDLTIKERIVNIVVFLAVSFLRGNSLQWFLLACSRNPAAIP